jgi:hypothetical protein
MIKKVQKGKSPTLLEAKKANELINVINALQNMEVKREGYIDKFEVSSNNSILTLSVFPQSQSGGNLDGFEELDGVYLCINGVAKQRTILVKEEEEEE